jgi:hypothetical protein
MLVSIELMNINIYILYLRFSRFIIFIQLFYYFGHIIMFSIEFENMIMFQIMRFVKSSAMILLLFIYY